MHLWTEYEGNTLAGYPLGRLLRSEGRSAFFATTTPDGTAAILRLTEAHFDEGELTTRWRKAAAVHHPHLQAVLHFGQTTFDNVPLACCLLRHTDASLSDVLRERALTTDETKEVAEAVAGALQALHTASLIHEHVDATNVFASDETVLLRSDCVRECTGDFEADTEEARVELRKRDIRDLGLLLLRCLHLDWQGTTAANRLPGPFDRIVPNALDGKWDAAAILAALEAVKPAPIRPAPVPAKPAVAATTATPATTTPPATTSPAAARANPAAAPRYSGLPPAAATTTDPYDNNLGRITSEPVLMESATDRIRRKLKPMRPVQFSKVTIGGAIAAAALLGVILWNTTGSKPVAAKDHTAVASAPAPVPAMQHAAPAPAPTVATNTPQDRSLLNTMRNQPGWHVIAYTYNYEQQAQAKAVALQKRYLDLHPQVFTPTGHAPYFVALGNSVDQDTATMLRNQARRAGLPRDTYIRAF